MNSSGQVDTLTESLCLQGAQLLFDQFVSPFLIQHAAKFDPVFATTKLVSLLFASAEMMSLMLTLSQLTTSSVG